MEEKIYRCCGEQFFIRLAIATLLVMVAGLMSGLTLGLMSMSLVDLEVLAKSGSPSDRKNAAKILPVVKRQHLLLCTLLICNAAAMEALPIFLHSLVREADAVLISVTLLLLFGEIIPQSVCSRHGLAIGATVAPAVQILLWICYPVAYPVSKAGKGGELSHDETTIIAGALELTEKTAKDAMTPISKTFAVDINSKLDRDLMKLILEKGHSRLPVYYEQPINIVGLILVKNLLSIHPAQETPVKNVTIRRIPRVPENMPLYDILNEFQKGHSHMAVVITQNGKTVDHPARKSPFDGSARDVRLEINGEKHYEDKKLKRKFPIWKTFPYSDYISNMGTPRRRMLRDSNSDVLKFDDSPLPKLTEEAVGVITMEDVIEELLQEEIYDETDHHEEA